MRGELLIFHALNIEFRMPREEADGGKDNPVRSIAESMNLKEGEEAVRRVLTEVYRRGKVGTKDLARAARLPVPVAAAIRREMEKRGLIIRRGGATLSEEGEKLAASLNLAGKIPLQSEKTPETSERREILEKLRALSKLRPPPDTTLDQSYATPETAIKRALYMLDKGDLAGRDVLLLGDDDFTSIAAALLGVAKSLTVVDIDERILGAIMEASDSEDLGVMCIRHDLRGPLSGEHLGRYDVVFTDPSYTVPGLELFLSRAVEALRPRKTASVYVAFADKPPLEMLEVHRAITGMGLFVRELIPGFNEYEGAEMFGNVSSMMRLSATEEVTPAVTGVFEGAIYTGEMRPTVRVYRCRCGARVNVGVGRKFVTIEELKALGCPSCGSRQGFRLLRRKNV